MKHARADYNRIQDPENKIPADEPVFLLRGQDVLAPMAVRQWAYAARASDADPAIVDAAFKQAEEMEQWQLDNKCKLPDL